MNKIKFIKFLVFMLLFVLSLRFVHADSTVYGWDMMTIEERIQHRKTIHNLETKEEREQYRKEHHKKMQERAKEKGIYLPDIPQYKWRDTLGGGARFNKDMHTGSGGRR